jgi:purine-binding chemotaxis protein CheW
MTEAPTHNQLDALVVRIEHELYAIPSGHVREIARYRALTPIPGAPRTLPGIISQRGTILPVADTRLILDLGLAEVTRATRLVLVHYEDTDVALLVDSVLDLTIITHEQIEPVPAALDLARARFLNGVVQLEGQPVSLLNLDELIRSLRDWE